MSTEPKLHFSEEFARFLEEPSREKLRELLRRRSGEYDFLDFKEIWPERAELAKDILAFANTGSGCLVVGVAEREDKTFEVKGVPNLEDKTKLQDGVKKYIPESVLYAIHDFEYSDSEYLQLKGKKFQVMLVVHDPSLIPVLSLADGKQLNRNRIYVRANNSSTEANHAQVETIITKRIEHSLKPAKGRELEEHLAELEALYKKDFPNIGILPMAMPFQPKAEFYQFIRRMIAKKQEIIERIIEG